MALALIVFLLIQAPLVIQVLFLQDGVVTMRDLVQLLHILQEFIQIFATHGPELQIIAVREAIAQALIV